MHPHKENASKKKQNKKKQQQKTTNKQTNKTKQNKTRKKKKPKKQEVRNPSPLQKSQIFLNEIIPVRQVQKESEALLAILI